MKLIPLEIGRLDTDLAVLTGDEGRQTIPVPAWLVEHPEGLVLFDTGLHPSLRTSSDRLGPLASAFRPDFGAGEELSERLAARGVRPSDVDLVVFSHLHFDHAGGTAEIPDARIVIQHDEWTAGHDPRYVGGGGYNPDDYDLGHDVQTIDGRHDLFGDGRVVCLPTPGHTRGHQSLRLELDSGPVVLTGDCIYFQQMLDEMRVPPFARGAAKERQLESMRLLADLRDREGCRLLFGHDMQQFRSLPSTGIA